MYAVSLSELLTRILQGSRNLLLRAQNLKVILSLNEHDTNASLNLLQLISLEVIALIETCFLLWLFRI